MFLKLYYFLKPILPRFLQLYFRRKTISKKYIKYKNVWPIFPGSEKKPDNWPGWPEGKDFALVLTHDVEHIGGYNKVQQVMEVERKYGFVSSFYFVPERDYKIESKLLQLLNKNGFEYGIHGLYHDGKLFQSEKIFLKRAKKINYYLQQWGAVGFRAPAMHHNLEWIGELNILYDLSTFDTDPFEPQPDGVGTIFPFLIRNSRHSGGCYIEMPYTLSQDFTPFIIHKDKKTEIWTKKLDWIVKHQGMALINVHPDYLNFNNDTGTKETYPVEFYISFLEYITINYEGRFWNALPKEIAQYSLDVFKK